MLLPLIALGIAFIVSRVPIQRRLTSSHVLSSWELLSGAYLYASWDFIFWVTPRRPFWFRALCSMSSCSFLFGITGKYTEDFAVGMFISLCYIYSQHPSTSSAGFAQGWQRLSPWMWSCGLLIVVLMLCGTLKSAMHGVGHFLMALCRNSYWLSEMILAIGFGACIAAILYGSTGLKAIFNWPLLRWVGLISFSLYIWHLPLIVLFQTRVVPLLPGCI